MKNDFTLKEWESQFFDRKIFSFELPAIAKKYYDWPKNALTTIKVSSLDYSCLDIINRHEFSFVDGELVFKKAVTYTAISHCPRDFDAYLAKEDTLEELRSIVSNLYINSRFREPWFTTMERNNFYQRWIENAVFSRFDDCCLVLKNEGNISGFVTIRIKGDEAIIGLIGVAKPYQGRGIGKQLLELIQDYCVTKSVAVIKVTTQTSNVSAANLYIKNGFVITDISYWFYKQV